MLPHVARLPTSPTAQRRSRVLPLTPLDVTTTSSTLSTRHCSRRRPPSLQLKLKSQAPNRDPLPSHKERSHAQTVRFEASIRDRQVIRDTLSRVLLDFHPSRTSNSSWKQNNRRFRRAAPPTTSNDSRRQSIHFENFQLRA